MSIRELHAVGGQFLALNAAPPRHSPRRHRLAPLWWLQTTSTGPAPALNWKWSPFPDRLGRDAGRRGAAGATCRAHATKPSPSSPPPRGDAAESCSSIARRSPLAWRRGRARRGRARRGRARRGRARRGWARGWASPQEPPAARAQPTAAMPGMAKAEVDGYSADTSRDRTTAAGRRPSVMWSLAAAAGSGGAIGLGDWSRWLKDMMLNRWRAGRKYPGWMIGSVPAVL